MPQTYPFFTKPNGSLQTLRIPPRLASWERAGHPDQVRLDEYVQHAGELLAPQFSGLPDPLALRLDVGLPQSVSLTDEHDLDNYAFPLVTQLSKRFRRQFSSVWCSKRHSETSAVAVDQAVPIDVARDTSSLPALETTASAETTAYKQQVHEQLEGWDAVAEGPVSLQLSFTVGPRRNWVNLWKPTIDALDRLLGRTDPERQWHPRDGRVVDLGMHCRIDSELGNRVRIAIVANGHP
ncbi:hypothetical protein [Haloechinothrix alba]|uniref:hypothetical protein n=1 Tax=Haloechinothrix alba TaxID=664784 RepID=UPI001C3C68AF|nr:hypothetical protein [Haloechinothrix alba]